MAGCCANLQHITNHDQRPAALQQRALVQIGLAGEHGWRGSWRDLGLSADVARGVRPRSERTHQFGGVRALLLFDALTGLLLSLVGAMLPPLSSKLDGLARLLLL